ncbi:hypothetical protein J2Z83_000062 [Virgibacillus natechei]|uniref:Uncharacterized protein n=1 Tax=Virgibacillus natechei TaxID=1216297 RepID=A0ABS4IBB2_9BACI|nr:hypothetical protein [Virgibacillus natechei]MBP1967970.1 hypothetical protein [Virgibacillus natechei]UZD14742.1 hypothetical protein OLD84_09680 [Virgibacillus natechei]
MAAENEKLVTAKNSEGMPVPAPQHYNSKADRYEHATGEDGASHVNVSNLPTNQDVTITNQKDTQTVDGSVEVDNFPENQPVSDAEVLNKLNELDAIKETQGQIIDVLQNTNESLLATNEKLSSVIEDGRLQSDTQLTGSNVENVVFIEVFERHTEIGAGSRVRTMVDPDGFSFNQFSEAIFVTNFETSPEEWKVGIAQKQFNSSSSRDIKVLLDEGDITSIRAEFDAFRIIVEPYFLSVEIYNEGESDAVLGVSGLYLIR